MDQAAESVAPKVVGADQMKHRRGLALGGLLGGSVAVERAFGVPGLGLALVQALNERDWMVIQNLVFLYGVLYTVINLIVDVSYAWLDPRIRYG